MTADGLRLPPLDSWVSRMLNAVPNEPGLPIIPVEELGEAEIAAHYKEVRRSQLCRLVGLLASFKTSVIQLDRTVGQDESQGYSEESHALVRRAKQAYLKAQPYCERAIAIMEAWDGKAALQKSARDEFLRADDKIQEHHARVCRALTKLSQEFLRCRAASRERKGTNHEAEGRGT